MLGWFGWCFACYSFWVHNEVLSRPALFFLNFIILYSAVLGHDSLRAAQHLHTVLTQYHSCLGVKTNTPERVTRIRKRSTILLPRLAGRHRPHQSRDGY